MKQEYEKIREEMLDSIKDEKIRAIYSSQFYTTPQFESEYYQKVKNKPGYLDIYKRWVLSQDPLCNIPDADLYKLRSGIIPFPSNKTSEILKYNKKLLIFFLDLLSPFIEKSVAIALSYYTLESKNLTPEQVIQKIEETAIQSLNLCDKETLEKAGYPSLDVAFMDMFKIIFSKNIGSIPLSMPDSDVDFIKIFEKEWKNVSKYSDNLYGFEVVPKFSPQDIFRYLKLPFKDKKYLELRKTDTYKQAINYIVSIASSFKPLPDPRIRTYFRKELAELFRPLVEKLIDISIKKGNFVLKNQKQILEDQIMKELPEIITKFNFFFATQKNLQKNKISLFEKLIFPLRGWLVKIGNHTELDEYPLTDYLSKKIKNRIKEYFPSEKNNPDLSLDKTLDRFEEDDDDDHFKFSDMFSSEQKYHENEIPKYDALDKYGLPIGWKINTFCKIVDKGKSTLQRWDRKDLLKSKRYTIGRKGYQTSYRAYTEEDITKVKEIDEKLKKKARHQI